MTHKKVKVPQGLASCVMLGELHVDEDYKIKILFLLGNLGYDTTKWVMWWHRENCVHGTARCYSGTKKIMVCDQIVQTNLVVCTKNKMKSKVYAPTLK